MFTGIIYFRKSVFCYIFQYIKKLLLSILTCFCNELSRLRTILFFVGILLLTPFMRFFITLCFNKGASPSKTNIGIAPTNNKLFVRKNKFLVKKKYIC